MKKGFSNHGDTETRSFIFLCVSLTPWLATNDKKSMSSHSEGQRVRP
jgi:hypothetical protein